MGVGEELSYITASSVSQLVNSYLLTSQTINEHGLSRVQRRVVLAVVGEERRNRKKLSLYLWRPLHVWVLTLGQEKGGRIFEVVFKVLNSAGDLQNRFSLKVFK